MHIADGVKSISWLKQQLCYRYCIASRRQSPKPQTKR